MSRTSAPPQGTGSEDQGSLLATYKKYKDMFDALPGFMKGVAALLTALATLIGVVIGSRAAGRQTVRTAPADGLHHCHRYRYGHHACHLVRFHIAKRRR